jgi:hypothetical protein
MCASSGQAAHWEQIDWSQCERQARRLQVSIVKVARRVTGSAHAELCGGLSRMRGNSHVRFSGEGVAATPLPYPTTKFYEFVAAEPIMLGLFQFSTRLLTRL